VLRTYLQARDIIDGPVELVVVTHGDQDHWKGLQRLDAAARGSGLGFRLLITPGIVALWPLVALAWRRARVGRGVAPHPGRPVSPERLRGLHHLMVRILLVLLPVAAVLALLLREAPDRPAPTPFPAAAPSD
jgi:hypothetical protein